MYIRNHKLKKIKTPISFPSNQLTKFNFGFLQILMKNPDRFQKCHRYINTVVERK